MDADLSIAQQEALLGWLNGVGRRSRRTAPRTTRPRCAARMTGVLAGLPEALKKHLEALLALENRVVEGARAEQVAEVDRVGEHERMELEESLRRLARSLHGGLTHKRKVSAAGGSTPVARCGATCASTASRSRRSRCAAPRTSRGW